MNLPAAMAVLPVGTMMAMVAPSAAGLDSTMKIVTGAVSAGTVIAVLIWLLGQEKKEKAALQEHLVEMAKRDDEIARARIAVDQEAVKAQMHHSQALKDLAESIRDLRSDLMLRRGGGE